MADICKTPTTKVAHVIEGTTEFVTLHGVGGDRTVITISQPMYQHMQFLAGMTKASDHINRVLKSAFERIERDFGDRVEAVATSPQVHDGELVIKVKPRGGVFNMDLAVALNHLAWELEDELCEAVGSEEPRISLGFRQELPGDGHPESHQSVEE